MSCCAFDLVDLRDETASKDQRILCTSFSNIARQYSHCLILLYIKITTHCMPKAICDQYKL